MRKIWRGLASALLAGMAAIGGAVPSMAQSEPAATGFADIGSSYARKEIEALALAGLLAGYDDGTFRPDRTATRAEAAKLIVLDTGLVPSPEGAGKFADMANGAWYLGYVGALVQAGIAQGTAADRFSPESAITREQLVAIFMRAMGLEETASALTLQPALADFGETADWAKPLVALAVQIGFVQGIEQPDGTVAFHPKEPVDRQALARLAYEFHANETMYRERAEAAAQAGDGTATGQPGNAGGAGAGSGDAGGSGDGGGAGDTGNAGDAGASGDSGDAGNSGVGGGGAGVPSTGSGASSGEPGS